MKAARAQSSPRRARLPEFSDSLLSAALLLPSPLARRLDLAQQPLRRAAARLHLLRRRVGARVAEELAEQRGSSPQGLLREVEAAGAKRGRDE